MSAPKLEFLPPDRVDSPGFTRGQRAELPVGGGHRLACWVGPEPDGAEADRPTVLLLHGGPGGQTRPESLTPWAGLPLRWVAVDQRGCGRSTPAGERRGQTLTALVDDLEQLRQALGLGAWALAAGSWGVRLALAYAARHPGRVQGLWLRSPFLGSLAETRRYIAPWRRWLGAAGLAALGEPSVAAVEALYAALPDPRLAAEAAEGRLPAPLDRLPVARLWQAFDNAQSAAGGLAAQAQPELPAERLAALLAPPSGPADASLQAAWALHALHGQQAWGGARTGEQAGLGAWVEARAIADRLPGPVAVVGGRADACCDPAVVDGLARLWPQAVVDRVDGAGHRMGDALLAPALRRSACAWAARLGPPLT